MFIPGPGIVYLLILLILLAFSIAIHISSTNLSLPSSPGITLATILLPLIAAANTLLRPRLLYAARGSLSLLQRIYPTTFQSLQAILTTALATYLLQQAFPGDAQSCHLATRWQRLFAAKDASAIRRIQNALECCGLNSVRDRAWPFPEGRGGGGAGRCVERFDRDTACAGPWGHEAAQIAGLELGIVLAVAVLQIMSLLIARPAKQWRHSWWAQGWRANFPEEDRVILIEDEERVRPLLEAAPDVQGEAEEAVGYSDVTPPRITPPNYGTGNGDAPRVVPSGLQPNAWSNE
ncbi:tetraspanin [Plectosphaerella plurivora]|uniref:Tetraspanin n=1 Tax=Plectosphaerella plurivora TaxID=936078 RepID=A0A9P8VDP5_9PEZI|nr:tetraspanin [Plectosphaerella plurivora]